MTVFLYSAALSVAAFLAQIVVWRLRPQDRHIRTLAVIFLAVLLFGLAFALAGILPRITIAQGLHISIFLVAVTLAYACLYSAIEADSPTVSIVLLTAARGKSGCRRDAYREVINDDLLIGSRLGALVRDNLAVRTNDAYALTAAGERLARLFDLTSRLLNVAKAG